VVGAAVSRRFDNNSDNSSASEGRRTERTSTTEPAGSALRFAIGGVAFYEDGIRTQAGIGFRPASCLACGRV
jgi:hypothetical protein